MKKTRKILVVCERNVYRSKMFELLAKKMLIEKGIYNIQISSRGLEKSKFSGSIWENIVKYPILEQERIVAKAMGVEKDFLEHVPKQLEKKMWIAVRLFLYRPRNTKRHCWKDSQMQMKRCSQSRSIHFQEEKS